MSKYNLFRDKVLSLGATHQESVVNYSKRKATQELLESPTLSHVKITGEKDLVPAIVSEDERIKKIRFLFLPDTKYKIGSLITHKNLTYLTLLCSNDDIYPQMFADQCNYDFVINTIEEKVRVGTSDIGLPKYEVIKNTITTPSVVYANVYSTLGNSTIQIPSGAVIARIPYREEYLKHIKLNDFHKINTGMYQVTEIDRTYAYYDREGFLEITLQRKVERRDEF